MTRPGREPSDPASPTTLRGAPPVEKIRYRLLRAGVETSPEVCWPWPGARNSAGYGRLATPGESYVHRIMYKATVGPIPDGMELDHKCRNRACCNPAHLEPVVHSENQRRMSRSVTGDPCKRGHVHEATSGSGCRQCRNEYMREYNRAYRAKLKAAGQAER